MEPIDFLVLAQGLPDHLRLLFIEIIARQVHVHEYFVGCQHAGYELDTAWSRFSQFAHAVVKNSEGAILLKRLKDGNSPFFVYSVLPDVELLQAGCPEHYL